MNKTLITGTAASALVACVLAACGGNDDTPAQPVLGTRSVPLLSQSSLQFRDLNRNGKLDPYEDWRLDAETRARDLVGRMTLAEKAGVMMHGTIQTVDGLPGIGNGSTLDSALMSTFIQTKGVNSFISRMSGDAATLAAGHNSLQALAEGARLAIPVSVSSDPRNHFDNTVGQSVAAGSFSKWPQPLGFAAIGDVALTRQFADIARREYRAVGLHVALSPQADLATEPRWPRVFGTFGEDVDTVSAHVGAYVEGFQAGTGGIRRDSVVAVVKHWVGYGAAKDGWDSHNPYGRFMTFPGANFAAHVRAFDGAFAAKAGAVMPTYSMPEGSVTLDGITLEPVGAGYDKALLTDLLRQRKGYTGVVLSDWAITHDCVGPCLDGAPAGSSPFLFAADIGMPWGVEALSRRARFAKAINAGLDQFGGTEESEYVVDAVNAGDVGEARIDESVTRILVQKFRQGLFENPFVDETAAATTVGQAPFADAGIDAQRKSLVLLQNGGQLLPLGAGARKVYLYGVDATVAAQYGFTIVATPEEADIAIVRMAAPFEVSHPGYLFGLLQHEGTLAYVDGNPDYEALKAAAAKVPTIATVYLERPAILTNVVDKAQAVIANFGVGDEALLDVLTGRAAPKGRLPVELPRSMDAVLLQRPDLPHDSPTPLFAYGFGLTY